MPLKRRDILAHRDAYSLLAMAIFVVMCVLYRRFTIDDAYIAYRYARHLGDGLGPVMNAGERVEGISNLPWTVLLGLLSAAGLEPHACAPVVSVLCGMACLALTAELVARLSGDSRSGGVAALLFAVSVPVVVWSVSGMETLAYTLAILGLTLSELRGLGTRKGGLPAGIWLGLVASLRPEGLLFAIPLAVAERAAGRWDARRLLGVALGAALVLVPLEVFRIVYYGDWLPNSARAKATLGLALLAPGTLYAVRLACAFPLPFAMLVPAARAIPERAVTTTQGHS